MKTRIYRHKERNSILKEELKIFKDKRHSHKLSIYVGPKYKEVWHQLWEWQDCLKILEKIEEGEYELLFSTDNQ